MPYAAAISTPGKVGSDWYVEYETKLDWSDTCDQWRLVAATDRVQHRSWTNGGTSAEPGKPSGTNIVNDPTTQKPFVLHTSADRLDADPRGTDRGSVRPEGWHLDGLCRDERDLRRPQLEWQFRRL